MKLLYTITIWWYGVLIRIVSLFSEKAKDWIDGRKELFSRLREQIGRKERWIWIHAASLGEFEQGRPLLEHIRRKHPETGILLTFFSPSGYLIRKDYAHADYVTYMPLDTVRNARAFVEIVKPVVAIFVKYEIWYHHLIALEKNGIPVFLISANLRGDQIYFKPSAGFLLERLKALRCIFTQTQSSAEMLRRKGFMNVVHTGDTRLDRVLEIAASPKDYTWLKACLPDESILIAGSTWPEDEKRLIPALNSTRVPAIIAPHEITHPRLEELKNTFQDSALLSELRSQPRKVRYVIVDTMGELAYLYALGSISYVGGGFGKGIHNVLEPVAHELPVIIGPRYKKFAEAVQLVEAGVVRQVETADDVVEAIRHFLTKENSSEVRQAIGLYVQENRGATLKIYQEIAICL